MSSQPSPAEPPGNGPELELRGQQLVLAGTRCPVLSPQLPTLPASQSGAAGAVEQKEPLGPGGAKMGLPESGGRCRAQAATGKGHCWEEPGEVGLGLGPPWAREWGSTQVSLSPWGPTMTRAPAPHRPRLILIVLALLQTSKTISVVEEMKIQVWNLIGGRDC